jgi:hypothetical protein
MDALGRATLVLVPPSRLDRFFRLFGRRLGCPRRLVVSERGLLLQGEVFSDPAHHLACRICR